MSKGSSMYIGLKRVDPKHYKDGHCKPWNGELNADFVVLNACQTALGEIVGGDDVIGFTQGLL
jgi:CHAT domain-containing protein